MGPENMAVINSVADDMALQANATGLARQGQPAATRMVGEIGSERGVPMLDRAMMVLNNMLKRTGGIRREMTMRDIAQLRQNPEEMAKVLGMANELERPMIAQLLRTAPGIGMAESVNQVPQ